MDKLKDTKFNGLDFAVWKFTTGRFLDCHGLYEVVSGTEERPTTNSEEWSKKDKKAQMII